VILKFEKVARPSESVILVKLDPTILHIYANLKNSNDPAIDSLSFESQFGLFPSFAIIKSLKITLIE
jgi:hypothetical protein